MARRFWLMKVEPSAYTIADLERDGRTGWEGVRNYKARNLLRDEIKPGDGVLFYASNADPSGVTGIAEIVRGGYPDPLQFQRGHHYYDPKAEPDAPRWYAVEIGFVERFADVVSLAEVKAQPALSGMMVIKRGMRLSVQPVTAQEFETVRTMGRGKRQPDGGRP
jgi:predicted RNA-binding protein with PUA-like domain